MVRHGEMRTMSRQEKQKGIDSIKRVQESLQPLEPENPEAGEEVTYKWIIRGKYPDGTTWEREMTPDDEENGYMQ